MQVRIIATESRAETCRKCDGKPVKRWTGVGVSGLCYECKNKGVAVYEIRTVELTDVPVKIVRTDDGYTALAGVGGQGYKGRGDEPSEALDALASVLYRQNMRVKSFAQTK